MSDLIVEAGPYRFTARLETDKAPKTCAAFLEMLPFRQSLLHVRWSGESTWVPLGDLSVAVPHENATTYPLPYIPSRVAQGAYLPLFVPYVPRRHGAALQGRCPSARRRT